MHTSGSSRPVSPEIANVSRVPSSASSQSVFSKNASHPAPVQVLEGQGHSVACLCFYNEDKLLSGSGDETLRRRDLKTGRVEALSGHTGTVWGIDVSLPDGKMIVSGSADKTIRIWNGESGEKMHVFEGHEEHVNSVEFSQDSSRVVSGSDDRTVRVWLVETGKLAFEPIECHGSVFCVRYSPGGDKIASGADSVQIWNAETGVGIFSIRNSPVHSLAWTADGTHVIGGGRRGEVTVWNSHDGGQLRTWKAYDQPITALSLSPAATHLATSSWNENTAFVFDFSTGEKVATLEHSQRVNRVAFSPSGRLIATGCDDKKVRMWSAPASEHPQTSWPQSRTSLSLFLDQPVIPPVIRFWDSLSHLSQQASPQPQGVFKRFRNTFANVITRRRAAAVHTSPVRETVEVVEVAAGRELVEVVAKRHKTFWEIVVIPTFNAMQRILYMGTHCSKPGDPDDEVPAVSGTNLSDPATRNAAISDQSEPAGGWVIRTQPKRTKMAPVQRLSGAETSDTRPDSLQTPVGNAVMRNPPESIEMVAFPPAIPQNLLVSGQAFPPPPATQATPCALSTVAVTSVLSSISLSTTLPTSQPLLSHDHNSSSTLSLSPTEIAMVKKYRRCQAAAELPSGRPAQHRPLDIPSSFRHAKHTSTPFPLSPYTPSRVNALPSHSSALLDPLLITAPALPRSSPLSESSCLFPSASPPPMLTHEQALDPTTSAFGAAGPCLNSNTQFLVESTRDPRRRRASL